MKYVIYTIIVFLLAIVQTSFLTALHLIFPYLNLLYIILFSYYIARKTNMSLYLLFIAGIFIDILTVSQVGLTSACIFISLLIYMLLHRIFPNGKMETVISITVSTISFFCISYITESFIQGYSLNGVIMLIPWALVNAVCILILSNAVLLIKPTKVERKIRID